MNLLHPIRLYLLLMNYPRYTSPMRPSLLLLLLLLTTRILHSASPTARQILDESDRRTKADSQYYEGTIRVEDASGRKREKNWRSWRLGHGGGARSMVQFLTPTEVKGVTLLTFANAGKEDDQWLYTPALARDRRIAGGAKTERFLGTDFTYEDMQERDLDGAEYRLLGEEPCAGGVCWKIEGMPRKEKKSQYRRTVALVRQSDYATLEIKLEKPDGNVRTVTYADYETVTGAPPGQSGRASEGAGGVLVARHITMVDPQRKSRTVIHLVSVKFHLPFKSDFFVRENLAVRHEPPKN